jgi:choline kinase
LELSELHAVILLAGVGRRFGGDGDHPPKALARVGGKTLLRRHLEILRWFGVGAVHLVVGYKAEAIEAEVQRVAERPPTRLHRNPRFREGSMVSLWTAREVLRGGAPILLMDADVLYDHRLMGRLLTAPAPTALLLDRDLEPGDEPVKACVRGGRIVDLRKQPEVRHEWHGESVGFYRFAPDAAAEIARRTEAYVAADRTRVEHEEAIRDMILEGAPGALGFEDITGLPWTEIDFPEDLRRAETEIFPRLEDHDGDRPQAFEA